MLRGYRRRNAGHQRARGHGSFDAGRGACARPVRIDHLGNSTCLRVQNTVNHLQALHGLLLTVFLCPQKFRVSQMVYAVLSAEEPLLQKESVAFSPPWVQYHYSSFCDSDFFIYSYHISANPEPLS